MRVTLPVPEVAWFPNLMNCPRMKMTISGLRETSSYLLKKVIPLTQFDKW
jgi:hypothetical protein